MRYVRHGQPRLRQVQEDGMCLGRSQTEPTLFDASLIFGIIWSFGNKICSTSTTNDILLPTNISPMNIDQMTNTILPKVIPRLQDPGLVELVRVELPTGGNGTEDGMRHGSRSCPALTNDAVGTEIELTNDDGGIELVDDLSPMREGAGPQLWGGTEEVDIPKTTGRSGPDLAPVRLADEVIVGEVSVAVGEGLARSGIGKG